MTVFVEGRHPLGHNLGHNFRRPTCQSGFLYRATTHFLALAVIAVAPALLRTVYHVLATGQEYRLGPDYYEHRDVDQRARAVHALERLGVKVTVEAVA